VELSARSANLVSVCPVGANYKRMFSIVVQSAWASIKMSPPSMISNNVCWFCFNGRWSHSHVSPIWCDTALFIFLPEILTDVVHYYLNQDLVSYSHECCMILILWSQKHSVMIRFYVDLIAKLPPANKLLELFFVFLMRVIFFLKCLFCSSLLFCRAQFLPCVPEIHWKRLL
jgi:hypothetical protein